LEWLNSFSSNKRNRVYAPKGLTVLYGPPKGHEKGTRWTVIDGYGCAQLEYLNDSEAINCDTIYIENFEVKPEFRGIGHGRSLYLKVEDMARNVGASWIQIDSEEDALGFWLKLGFQATGVVYYRGKFSMVKSLRGN
jgi:GNAT superfamily N-acetyltransferase